MISRAIPASLLLLSAVAVTGCGVGLQDTTGSTVAAAFKGHIQGGQQPVAHASVQFFAASTAGYAHAVTAISPVVPTDANGQFSLSSAVTCPTGTSQAYVVSTSGNPGLNESGGTINNSAIALVAALGNCNTLNSATFINVNEVTTVAAA